MTPMTKERMQEEIRRLSPFRHNLELPYDLSTAPPGEHTAELHDDARVENLVAHAFPPLLDVLGGSFDGLAVLDAACNSGGFSVEAARRGAERVLGFDVVDRYVEQADFVKEALELENVEFRKLDLYEVDPGEIGTFDVTFCFGLLYHLENPVLGMRKLAAVTRRVMVVDTNILSDDDRRAMWQMTVPSVAGAPPDEAGEHGGGTGAGSATNLWRDREYCQMKPNAVAVRRLLEALGFEEVRWIRPTHQGLAQIYRDGRRRTFIAVRGS